MKYFLSILFFVLLFMSTERISAQDNSETLYFDEDNFNELFSEKSSSEVSRQLGQMMDEIASADIIFDDNAADVPIDGGLGFLLAAGIGYGANRLRKHKKGINADQNDFDK